MNIAMKLYVVRHGETPYNVAQVACGTGDAPLTEKGIRQAKELAGYIRQHQAELAIRHIVVSNLLRARQTCRYVEQVLGLQAVVDERFHELSVGDYLGLRTGAETPEVERYRRMRAEPFVRLSGGESFADTLVRVYPALDEIRRIYAGENVLIICHGIIMRTIATYFGSFNLDSLESYKTKNCQMQVFDMEDGRVVPPSCVPLSKDRMEKETSGIVSSGETWGD